MGVSDGQPVNAAITNPAFINKNIDDAMPNKLDFTNNDPASGPQFHNNQRNVNSIMSFLGMVVDQVYNLLPTWATTNRGSSGDNVFQRVGAIDTAFDPTTGHKHTGSAGDGPQVSAFSLSNIPLVGFGVQGVDLVGVTGTSTVITSQMGAYTASTSQSQTGVVTNAPYNKNILRNSANDDQFVDATGNTVYGRITFSSGVWTLSYYSEISGVETPYTFSSSGVRFYFQLLSPVLSPTSPVYSELFFVPSENATADVITATTSLQGKVQLATTAQPVGSSSSGGTANAIVANQNHTHQGVHSVTTNGGSQTFADVNFKSGKNVTVSQSSQDITIDLDSSTSISSATALTKGVYFCDVSGGSFSNTLPDATTNQDQEITVKVITLTGSNTVTNIPSGTDTIEGQASDVMGVKEYRKYKAKGTVWYLMNT